MTISNKVASFNPADVDVIIAGNTITGYADGSYVDIERDNESFTKVTGANGEVTRVQTNDKGGKCTMTLLQSSESNLILSNLLNIDEATGAGTFPLMIKDNSGGTIMAGAVCWINKPAKVTYSKSIENREWVIDIAHLVTHIAGNPDVSE